MNRPNWNHLFSLQIKENIFLTIYHIIIYYIFIYIFYNFLYLGVDWHEYTHAHPALLSSNYPFYLLLKRHVH